MAAPSETPVTAPVDAAAAPTPAPAEAVDASKLLIEGQRLAALRNHSDAAEAFSKAVEALTLKHGELSIETVDPLILYGKALLATAIAASGVLGNSDSAKPAAAPVAGPSKPTASTSTAASDVPSGPQFHFGAVIEDDSEDEEADGADGDDAADGTADTSVATAHAPEDDLENAFGAFEQARVILQRQDTDESRMKLINVHSLLGDVATENEDFESAVKEHSAALKLQTALLPPHDRRLAETHMMIALALEWVTTAKADADAATAAAPAFASAAAPAPTSTGDSHASALEHMQAAKTVLELRLAQCSAGSTADDVAEVKDLKGVMVELDEKIEDLKQRPEMERQAAADKAAAEAALSGRAALPDDTPVNNLNSLVKKKKPAATPAPAPTEDAPLKRKADEPSDDSAKRQKTD